MKDKIEDILDNCISEIRKGKTVEDVLQQYPEAADKIRPLLGIAHELHSLPTPSASTSGLFHTMVKLSAQQTQGKTAPRNQIKLFSRPVLVRVAACILIIFTVGWTTINSTAQALPGDVLYPVKLFTERVRFFLTINHEKKAELRIVFSEERLKELVKKYHKGDGVDKQLLIAMLEEAKLAVKDGSGLSGVSRDLLVSRVAYLSEFQGKTLEQLKKHASLIEQDKLKPFMDMCRRRCNCMRKMMVDTKGPHGKTMQNAMKMCPMWQENSQQKK